MRHSEVFEPLARSFFIARRFAGATALTLAYGSLQRLISGPPAGSLEATRSLQARFLQLLEEDWRDVREGVLPAAKVPWLEYAWSVPAMLREIPRYGRRARAGRFDDLDPEAAPPGRYPSYFERNFHFQSEGYLGHTSARLYDLQVELLFGGTADLMRRRLVPPLVRFARAEGFSAARPMRLLDVACGTGHLLREMGAALPGARLFGVDLSPPYLARARALLPREHDVSLVCENAEALPFPDGYFDAVTCLYLLHEVPADVRQRILAEIARVARPGALIVIGDSLQPADAPELSEVLTDFPRRFHEPYYLSYLRDDLAQRLRGAGLVLEEVRPAFLTRVAVAHRP